MTRATTWTNADGLVVGFGRNFPEREVSGVVAQRGGSEKEAVLHFTYQSSAPALSLPAGAVVKSVVLEVTNAWTGGTDITVGDGNDADGWITSTAGAVANLTAGARIVADGAYAIGDNADNRANPKVYATADTIDVAFNGTFTAGAATLRAFYI